MSTDYFTKCCAKSKLAIPSTDGNVRILLANSGASVLDTKGKPATALRREHAAAVLWAQANLDKDRSWTKLPDEARDTLIALFPISQSLIDKGGHAWAAPCRALIRAYIADPEPPKKKAKSAQISKMLSSDDESSSGSAQDEATPPPEKEKPGKKPPKGKDKGGSKGSATLAPYLPSSTLLAALPPHRRAQLHLAESWSTENQAKRQKQLQQLASNKEFGGRYEDPSAPIWSQRITLRRGPGSAFSDEEVKQDGKNLASVMRWDSTQLLYASHDHDAVHRMTTRAARVQTSWDRFIQGGRIKTAPSSAVLAAIFQSIREVLDNRVAGATKELRDAGPAGEEIIQDMTRQRQEVTDLFASYEQYLAALFVSANVDYTGATRRANALWYGLLHPAVMLLTQEANSGLASGLDAQAEAAFQVTAPVAAGGAPAPAPSAGEGGLGLGPGVGNMHHVALPPPATPPPPYQPNPYQLYPFYGQGGAGGMTQPPPPQYLPQYHPPAAYPAPMSPGPSGGAPPGAPATPPTTEKASGQTGAGAIFRPVSAGIVGQARGTVVAPRRVCTRATCSVQESHHPWECPLRYVTVLGTPPPGFLASGEKEPSAWAGADITPATAAAWKVFLGMHPEILQAPKVTWVTNFD